MIDFRYHVVSLVSVFLALAVGIALGAGPLKGPIGSALTSEVQSLREAKLGLRAELDTAQAGIQHRDDFTRQITSELVSGQLQGGTVALVTTPEAGVPGDKELTEALIEAGATVTSRIGLTASWAGLEGAQARAATIAQLSGYLPASMPADAEEQDMLDALLTTALVTTDGQAAGSKPSASTAILETMSGQKLISVDGEFAGLATEAVIVVPAIPEAVSGTSVSASGEEQVSVVWRNLSVVLDLGCVGTVMLGPASSATTAGAVAAVRSDTTAAKIVSTVDTGATPMGVIATVLALREQIEGKTGAYGFGDGASAPLPPRESAP